MIRTKQTTTVETSTVDTTIPRALAVLLVMNSHLERFYPFSFLADGGMIGLALFFAASGFGVTASDRIRTEPFPVWMWRRIRRLYPAVIVTVLLFGLVVGGHWKDWSVADFVAHFIYPTKYHYIAKIIPFYVVLFVLARLQGGRRYQVAMVALSVGLAVAAYPDVCRLYSNPVPLKTGKLSPIFLWQVFLAITLLAAMGARNVPRFLKSLSVGDYAILGLLFAGYAALKLTMAKFGILPWLFPAYFAVSILFSFALFRILSHPQFVEFIRRWPKIWFATAMLSSISLEIYLVHAEMMHWACWQEIVFPWNIVAFGAVSISLAYVVHSLASRTERFLAPSSAER